MAAHSLFHAASNSSAASILLPCVAAILTFRRQGKALRTLAVWFFISMAVELYLLYSAGRGINNMYVFHIFSIIEFVSFAVFYYYSFRQKSLRQIILVSIVSFSLFSIYHSFFVADVSMFNNITRVVESLLLTLFGLCFFYEMLESELNVDLRQHPHFWINSGVLLYFMGNFFIFMLYNIFLNYTSPIKSTEYWILHSILNILANILYCIGFICNRRLRK